MTRCPFFSPSSLLASKFKKNAIQLVAVNVCRTVVNTKTGEKKEETITAGVMQPTGADAVSEHATIEQVFIIMKQLHWKKAGADGVEHLFDTEEDRLEFERLCRSVISDGASTALNVSRLHELSVIADLKEKNPDKTKEEMAELLSTLGAVAMKSCGAC